MKVGMNLLLWTAAATDEHKPLFEDIKRWGFDGVELPMFGVEGSPWGTLGKTLDALELERTVVAVLPDGASLISEELEIRAAAVEFLRQCVNASGELGAALMAGPLYAPVGWLVGRGPTDEERKWAVEGLHAAGEYAKTNGILLSVEPLNRFETYFANSLEQTAELVDLINLDNVGVLFDTFHANIEEKNVSAAIERTGKRINHVHASANDRATPGEDHVPWEAVMGELKNVGYDGWLTIEAFGAWMPEIAGATCIWRKMAPSEEHIATRGLDFLRTTWEAVG